MSTSIREIIMRLSAQNKAKGVMAGFRRDIDTAAWAMRRMAIGALAVAGRKEPIWEV